MKDNSPDNKTLEIFDEAIKAEKLAAALYNKYALFFSDDKEFWSKLSSEELDHAGILEHLKEQVQKNEDIPDSFFSLSKETLQNHNQKLQEYTKQFDEITIIRKEAYQFAIRLEEQSIEFLFQQTAGSPNRQKSYRDFKEIVQDEKNHAVRIHKLMTEKNLLF